MEFESVGSSLAEAVLADGFDQLRRILTDGQFVVVCGRVYQFSLGEALYEPRSETERESESESESECESERESESERQSESQSESDRYSEFERA